MEKETMVTAGNPKISVIVPVYKVEPYLRCCIDSILAQTFTDFELILVDDGSPDHCGAICDEYAAQDSRITVIHQENQGVSAARNAALDWVFANSNSAWITFVDSDDAIVPEYLEILHRYGQETDADVVITNGIHFTEDSELQKRSNDNASFQIISGKEACIYFYREDWHVTSYPWGKFCKRDILRNQRFPVGITLAEDEALIIKSVYKAGRICLLSSNLYCYRHRDNGASGNFSKYYHWLFVLDENIDFFRQHQEPQLAKFAGRRKRHLWLYLMKKAKDTKKYNEIPDEYKLPAWKFCLYLLEDTVLGGGLITNKLKRLLKK